MELALRLMQKVGKVDSVLIHFNFLDQYEVQPNEENKMTKYFKLLNAFRGTRQTYCKAKFTELDIQELSECIFHCDSSYGLYTAYCMYDNDFHGPDNADLDLPGRTSSIIGPEIFDNLQIDIFRDNSDLKYQYLKYSFLNCPELQSFELHYYAYWYGEMVSTIKYTHNKENPIGSDQPNYEIDLLEIEHIIPDQHFFNLVTTYLKDIELKAFIYTTVSHVDIPDSDFVLLKCTNGEGRCYYLNEEKGKTAAQVEYIGNPTTTTTSP
ncbi:hypothetical protein HPULCUR_005093 [Helicostylum pulchrum]|uniref:Uncharacterized protein n=1 Tax=Helicostylum pulchrum TaxID=562976 RepID=A0ABP9XY99_9FUNG